MEIVYNSMYARGLYPFAHSWSKSLGPRSEIDWHSTHLVLSSTGEHFSKSLRVFTMDSAYILVDEQKLRNYAYFQVMAKTDEILQKVVTQLNAGINAPSMTEGTVAIGFWRMDARGNAKRDLRTIDSRPWETISRNYGASVHNDLDRFINIHPGNINGRIALVYGPAGTGQDYLLALGSA